MKRPFAISVVSGLLGITASMAILFWTLFLTGKIKAAETDQDEAFERAFPAADSWMILCAGMASLNLPKMNRRGLFAGIAAGSALIFLSCMDILYSLENKKYWPMNPDRAQMLVIHLWTASVGSSTLALLWKHRDRFQGD